MSRYNRSQILSVLFIVLSALAFNKSSAQAYFSNYSFSQSSGSYSAITGGTVAASGTSLNSQNYKVPLPFDFVINNVPYDTTYISINGYLAFGGNPGSATWAISQVSSGISIAAGFAANLASYNSTTELRYQTLGTAPNRQFVVQWKNFGYPSSTQLKTTFQIQLFEGSSEMRVVYDTVNFTGSNLSTQVGLRGVNTGYYYNRSGNWSSSSAGTSASSNIVTTSSNKPSLGLTYSFLPPQCATIVQPTNLDLVPKASSVNGSFNKSSNADKYMVIRTNKDSMLTVYPVNGTNYAANTTIGNGTIIKISTDTTFTSNNLTPHTLYRYTIIPYVENCLYSPKYNTTAVLTDTVRTYGPRKYVWTPTSGTHDYMDSSKWSPLRLYADYRDTLIFSSGGASIANNVSTAIVGEIRVINNTKLNLVGQNANKNLYVINNIIVDNSSVLTLDSAKGLTLSFYSNIAAPKYADIRGRMVINNNNEFDASSGDSTLFGSKVVLNNTAKIKCSKYTNFKDTVVLNDTTNITPNTYTYIHKVLEMSGQGSSFGNHFYTYFLDGSILNYQRNGGEIPYANYAESSTLNITGITNDEPYISHNFSKVNYGNFIWDCANQNSDITIGSQIDFDTIKANMVINNTGGYIFTYGSTLPIRGNYIQNNGYFRHSANLILSGDAILNSGTFERYYNSTIRFKGNLIQSANHYLKIRNSHTFFFEGSKHQYVNIGGTIDTLNIDYILDNIKGASLTGTLHISKGRSNTINAGNWTGQGRFKYSDTTTNLVFKTSLLHHITAIEWPTIDGPTTVELDVQSSIPQNRLYIPGSRTIPDKMIIKNGILALGNYDLIIDSTSSGIATPSFADSTRMIATNGTGRLVYRIPATGSQVKQYMYPIGDINGIPQISIADLKILPTGKAREVGIVVVDQTHPNDSNSTNHINRYWRITDNGTDTVKYLLDLSYPQSDIVGSEDFAISSWSGNKWRAILSDTGKFNIFRGNYPNYQKYVGHGIFSGDTTYSSMISLNGDFTARTTTAPKNTYVWTGNIDNDYQKSGNWSPNRVTPLPTDILKFNDGLTDSIENITKDTVGRIICTNNTNVVFSSMDMSNYGNYYLQSDKVDTTDELQIDLGSTLNLAIKNYAFKLWLIGDSATAQIDGNMEFTDSVGSVYHWFYTNLICDGCMTTVSNTGKLKFGPNISKLFSDTSSLTIRGTVESYNIYQPVIPDATYGDSSIIYIKGVTGSNLINPPAHVSVNDLVYDCDSQTSNLRFSLPRVRGKFSLYSTGTGKIQLGTTYNQYAAHVNKYVQTDGTAEIFNLFVSDTMQQTGGLIINLATGTYHGTIDFNGSNNRQYISLKDSIQAGAIVYKVSNPKGITLVNNGSLTNNFTIHSYGGLEIASAAQPPVSTSLHIKYDSTNTYLSFWGNGNRYADSIVYPIVDGPQNVTLNVGTNDIVYLSGNRNVPGTLKMTSGTLNIGTDTLTIGTSITNTGTLDWTSGNINLTTGALRRWYGTTSLPTTTLNLQKGLYPIGSGIWSRHAQLHFSTDTALNSGGTITLSHANIAGKTSGLSIADGSYTINNRTNSNWQFSTANGLTMQYDSISIDLRVPDNYVSKKTDEFHIINASSVVGIHNQSTGSTPSIYAHREGLDLTDLTSAPLYIGTADSNMSGIFVSIKSGKWNSGSTWDVGTVPTLNDKVYISTQDTVVVDAACNAKDIYVLKEGILRVSSNNINIDTLITNKGQIEIVGGSLKLGPTGGGRSRLSVEDSGRINISSGSMVINGSLCLNAQTYFEQTGGNIIIDGNGAGDTAASVPLNTAILEIATPNITATSGSILIVDPHAAPSATNAYTILDKINSGWPSLDKNHTLILGDGISTDTGGHANGFTVHYTSTPIRTKYGSLTVNGTPSVKNRAVTPVTFNLSGDMTLNSNSIFNNNTVTIKGDLTVHSSAVFNTGSSVTFCDFVGGYYKPHNNKQKVTGQISSFVNTGGNNFRNINIYNTSSSGVTFDIGDIRCSTFSLTGVMNLGSATLIKSGLPLKPVSSSLNQATGWIAGKYQQLVVPNTYSASGEEYLFPIGDTNNYTPIIINLVNVSQQSHIRAHTIIGDHPQIASSIINPLKSVNRQYVIDTIGKLHLNGHAKVTLGWSGVSVVDTGIMWPDLISSSYLNNSWHIDSNIAFAANNIQLIDTYNVAASYQVGEAGVAPIITQQPTDLTQCANIVAFISLKANVATSYQWQLRSGNIWSDLSTGIAYSSVNTHQLIINNITTTMDNNQYRCIVSNNFGATISDTIVLNVDSSITPTITITSNIGDTVCAGSTVIYSATTTNAGNTPAYQWYKNGIAVGNNGSSYTASSLASSDSIYCILNSSSACANPDSAISNSIVMHILPSTVPSVVLSVSPNDTICTGTLVTFTTATSATGSNPGFEWYRNGSLLSTTSNSYSSSSLTSNDNIVVKFNSGNQCATPAYAYDTIGITVNTKTTPTVQITKSTTDTICSGTSVTFTASATNAGSIPSYQWKVNNSNVGTNSSTYTTSTLTNGDAILCIVTSSDTCVTKQSDTSNIINIGITQHTTPSVTISIAPNDTICSGTSVTFTASATNAGSVPSYQWKVNNTNVGTNSSTYSTNSLSNNDNISCIITSSDSCATQQNDTSNVISITVNPIVTPSVSLNVSPNDTVCAGTSVNFTATATNGGTSPSYKWYKNGSLQSAIGNTYTAATLNNGDEIAVEVSSSSLCLSTSTADDTVTMSVRPMATPSVTITKNTNDTICAGTTITFTATAINGGNTPSYQWKINNSNVGTNNSTFSSSTLSNGDNISCIVTSSDSCVTKQSDTSNVLTIGITQQTTPLVSITVSPNDTICNGTSVTFTAATTDVGVSPTYQWRLNNANVGTNSSTYTSSSLTNNDNISCIVTSSDSCVTKQNDTSNIITIKVNPIVTPSVSISVSPNDTVCANTTVTFTATPTSGGTSPIYQWFKNGIAVGSNSSTYSNSNLSTNDTITCVLLNSDSCTTNATDTSNAIRMEVTPLITPNVAITVSPNDTICSGTSVTFTANITNGGSSPSYLWKWNGFTVGNMSTYTSSTLSNNDSIVCILSSNATCLSQSDDTSNSIIITVNPVVTPTVNLVPNPSDTICQNSTLSYTANVINGGTAPAYQWKVNGINAVTSNSYTSSTWANNDVVTCDVTSNAACATTTQASDTNTVTVLSNVIPNITIAATPDSVVCANTIINFNSNITNGGTAPTFQWLRNGINITGATNSTLLAPTIASNDVISCIMTSSDICITKEKDTSNAIKIRKQPTSTPTVSITASPNTTIAQGTQVTFTANVLDAGTNPSYQWSKNTNPISGETNSTYITSTLADQDKISVTIKSSDSCSTLDSVISNTLTITVNVSVVNRILDEEIYLYPNPNEGSFILKGSIPSNVSADAISYQIIDIVGHVVTQDQVIVNGTSFQHQIELNGDVTSGIYYLRLEVDGLIYTKKFNVLK